MILEKAAHGIKILHRYNIVIRVVEEHDVEVAARRPAAGERVLTEGCLESERQGTADIEDGICAEVTRLLGLDKFFVKGLTLVFLAEEPLIEIRCHGIL